MFELVRAYEAAHPPADPAAVAGMAPEARERRRALATAAYHFVSEVLRLELAAQVGRGWGRRRCAEAEGSWL